MKVEGKNETQFSCYSFFVSPRRVTFCYSFKSILALSGIRDPGTTTVTAI